MGMEPLSNTTLRAAIEAIDARILLTSPTDLGLVQAHTLKGTRVMPSQQGSTGFEVSRGGTRNMPEKMRNQDGALVEDIIVITLQRRISPKDQLTVTRAAIWDSEQAVINRVTLGTFIPSVTLVYRDSRDSIESEWVKTIITFTSRRQMQVGAG